MVAASVSKSVTVDMYNKAIKGCSGPLALHRAPLSGRRLWLASLGIKADAKGLSRDRRLGVGQRPLVRERLRIPVACLR